LSTSGENRPARLCSGRTCQIKIDAPVAGRFADWEQAYTSLEKTIEKKYDLPQAR
jgi:hypothetical protein